MATLLETFIPGQSASVVRLRQDIARLNLPSNLAIVRTVLIVGESGTGKTYVGRVLAAHREAVQEVSDVFEENSNLESYLSHFDEINLPNLPETLVESELFGHIRGSFTDAKEDKLGLLSGEGRNIKTDILLDEIGDAPPLLQAKLLQVVESGRFRRLGAAPGDDEVTQARLIFATNRVLEEDVASGRFREDLYWRLNTIRIEIPPLREQQDLIETLLESFRRRFLDVIRARGHSDDSNPNFSVDDCAWARAYRWPGNIRELRAAVQRWLVYGGEVRLRDVTLDAASRRFQQPKVEANAITERLSKAQSLGSLGELLADSERGVKQEIVDWFARTRPTNEELELRFPKMQARSVRQKLSDWRRDLDKG